MSSRWLEFEHHACEHHRLKYGHTVWHWSHVSENILLKAGFMNNTNNQRLRRKHGSAHIREFGLDGIALDESGVYHGIQAKNWSHTLCANHLGSFFFGNIFPFAAETRQLTGLLVSHREAPNRPL
jgi:hypothetical protein